MSKWEFEFAILKSTSKAKSGSVYHASHSKTGGSTIYFKYNNYKYKCTSEGCKRDFKTLIDRAEHIRLTHPEMNNHELSLVDRHIEIPCENCELRVPSSEDFDFMIYGS